MIRSTATFSWSRGCLLFVGFAILCCTGCATVFLCNGTGEPVFFETDLGTFEVDPCECRQIYWPYTVFPEAKVFAARDSNGEAYFFDQRELLDASFWTYDGFSLFRGSGVAPDLNSKITIFLRNQSNEAIFIRPDLTRLPSSTLIPPGESREFMTIKTGTESWVAYDSTGENLDSCLHEDMSDGDEIIWDGITLQCVENPAGMAAIDICNDNPDPNGSTVIFVLQGGDPHIDGVIVNRGACDVLDVPLGTPATIEVYFIEGNIFLDDCTINDPTNGDSATWDGIEVTCIDL